MGERVITFGKKNRRRSGGNKVGGVREGGKNRKKGVGMVVVV